MQNSTTLKLLAGLLWALVLGGCAAASDDAVGESELAADDGKGDGTSEIKLQICKPKPLTIGNPEVSGDFSQPGFSQIG